MDLNAVFINSWVRDGAATLLSLGVALSWLRLIELLAARRQLESKLSRKLIHIGTGPLFVLCWQFFSAAPAARYFAALVPLVLTGQFVAIGLGWIQNPQTVQAMTRTGKPAEILRGPLYYGIVFVVCTIVFWRHSPIGILALMILCGGVMGLPTLWGDGLAVTSFSSIHRKAGRVRWRCLSAVLRLALDFLPCSTISRILILH